MRSMHAAAEPHGAWLNPLRENVGKMCAHGDSLYEFRTLVVTLSRAFP